MVLALSKKFSTEELSKNFPPESLIKELRSGNGFANQTLYSAEESLQLEQDIERIVERILLSTQPTTPQKIALSIGPRCDERKQVMKTKALLTDAFYISPQEILGELTLFKSDILNYTQKSLNRVWDKESAEAIAEREATKKWTPAAYATAYIALKHLLNNGHPIAWEQEESWEECKSEIFCSTYLRGLGYEVELVSLSTSSNQDSLLAKMGIHFSQYVDKITFYYIQNGFLVEKQISRLERIEQSNVFAIKVFDDTRYRKITSLYNLFAALNGFARWEEIIKDHEFYKESEQKMMEKRSS
jgi:hypothetical protein